MNSDHSALRGLRPEPIADEDMDKCDGCAFHGSPWCPDVPCTAYCQLDGKELGCYVIWVKQE